MDTDPERVMELLLGIPGVRVLTVELEPTGVQQIADTPVTSRRCS